IKGSIIDELRSLDWVPRSVRAKAREIEKANAKLEHQLHRAPTDAEVAKELDMTLEEFNEALTRISNSSVVALDELWTLAGAARGLSSALRARERSGAMPRTEADKIRNVALVGHRGSGKTSLHEALLFQAGAINRLGSVADGSTVSDSAPDEKSREMSISSALSSFEWDGRKINLIDTPGEPSFVADALAALRVSEGAVFVVNAVMGVEVNTDRLWQRAAELEMSRLIFINMLDRERADFFRSLDSLKSAFGPHVVATEIPIGSEHEVSGVIDLVDMKAYEYDGTGRDNCREIPIPDDLVAQAEEYREKLM